MRVSASVTAMFLAIAVGVAPRMEAAEPAAPAQPAVVKVGIMEGMFKGVPPALVKAGGDQFGELFKAIVGLPGAAETEADYRAMAKKLNDNKLQLAVFHGFEWAWLKKENPDLAPLALTVPPQLPQAAIVVNAKSAYTGPQDLKGANIDIPFNMKAHGYLYGEKLEKAHGKAVINLMPDEETSMDEFLDLIGKNKAQAVLVDGGSFAAYQKQNPGKAGKFKILCQSDILPQTVLIYNTKSLSASTVKQIQDGLLGATKNSNGKVFLFMWNLKGFELPNAGFEDLLKNSLVAFPTPMKK